MKKNSKEVTVVKFDESIPEIIDIEFEVLPEFCSMIENNFFKKFYTRFITNKIKNSIKDFYDTTSYKNDIDELFAKANDLVYVLATKDNETIVKLVDDIINNLLDQCDFDEYKEDIEEELGVNVDEVIQTSKELIIEFLYLRRTVTSCKDFAVKSLEMMHNNKTVIKSMKLLNDMVNKAYDMMNEDMKDGTESIEEYIPSEDEICEVISNAENPEGLDEEQTAIYKKSIKDQINKYMLYTDNILKQIA